MTNQVSRINIFYLLLFLGEESTGQFDWGFSKGRWASYAIRQIALDDIKENLTFNR